MISCSNASIYRVSITQGTVFKQEDINRLEIGMTKDQVTYVMGQPSFENFFEKNVLSNNHIQPNINDWINHLSTLFPQVRLKQFLEIRSMDACSWDLICSQPAFWTGLLYDEISLDKVLNLIKSWNFNDIKNFYEGKSGQT